MKTNGHTLTSLTFKNVHCQIKRLFFSRQNAIILIRPSSGLCDINKVIFAFMNSTLGLMCVLLFFKSANTFRKHFMNVVRWFIALNN